MLKESCKWAPLVMMGPLVAYLLEASHSALSILSYQNVDAIFSTYSPCTPHIVSIEPLNAKPYILYPRKTSSIPGSRQPSRGLLQGAPLQNEVSQKRGWHPDQTCLKLTVVAAIMYSRRLKCRCDSDSKTCFRVPSSRERVQKLHEGSLRQGSLICSIYIHLAGVNVYESNPGIQT